MKKRFLTMLLAVTMVFTMAYPAMAEETKSIVDSDIETQSFEAPYYNLNNGGSWDGTNYILNGSVIKNAFFCDGTYTYYLQYDGTPMKDRLTYHPDGVHVIYFDENGHEVFDNYAHISMSISGDAVDDLCYFGSYGYMYVDVLTWNAGGTDILYVNPYGVIERNGWFQFSKTLKWADGTTASGYYASYGYGQSDGTLYRNAWTYDWNNNQIYIQGNGVMAWSGIYVGILNGPNSSAIESVDFSDNSVTVVGSLQQYENCFKEVFDTRTFTLSDTAVFYSCGEEDGPYRISRDDMMTLSHCYNGLAFVMYLDHGVITEIDICS